MNFSAKDGFPYYFDLVKDENYKTLFTSKSTITFLQSINEEKAAHRYAPDKWSLKEVVGHMVDHERIKMQRAFLLSRKQDVQLWGYDQDSLVKNSRFAELSFQQIMTDFQNVRHASISFIESLSKSQLQLKGMARQYEITLENFLKSIIGHEIHHLKIIKERYI